MLSSPCVKQSFVYVCFISLCAFSQQQQLSNSYVGVNQEDVRFFLWTRFNPDDPVELMTDNNQVLSDSHFSTLRPVKIFIHGFSRDGIKSVFARTMAQAYLTRNVNIISVDWKRLASRPNYSRAAKNTGPVGVLVARFIDFLIAQGTPLSAFHVIGFSLGAHVAGSAGNSLRSGRLPRITGLDPAAPKFRRPRFLKSLSLTDADFVDVIHTNGLPAVGFGIRQAIGHADFYPNGGDWQPGCLTPSNVFTTSGFCPHSKAYEYFAESIRARPDVDPLFIATRCSSFVNFANGRCGTCRQSELNTTNCVLMGEETPPTTRGVFYLSTNALPPYANGLH